MAFTEKWSFEKYHPPVKVYLHEAGRELVNNDVKDAIRYIDDLLLKNAKDFQTYDALIAMMWACRDECGPVREVEFSALSESYAEEWPGNPTISGFTFRNGIYVPENSETHKKLWCGECAILLGREEEFRGECKDLVDYMRRWPSNLPERVGNPTLVIVD